MHEYNEKLLENHSFRAPNRNSNRKPSTWVVLFIYQAGSLWIISMWSFNTCNLSVFSCMLTVMISIGNRWDSNEIKFFSRLVWRKWTSPSIFPTSILWSAVKRKNYRRNNKIYRVTLRSVFQVTNVNFTQVLHGFSVYDAWGIVWLFDPQFFILFEFSLLRLCVLLK